MDMGAARQGRDHEVRTSKPCWLNRRRLSIGRKYGSKSIHALVLRDHEISALHASTSWKISSPLRWVVRRSDREGFWRAGCRAFCLVHGHAARCEPCSEHGGRKAEGHEARAVAMARCREQPKPNRAHMRSLTLQQWNPIGACMHSTLSGVVPRTFRGTIRERIKPMAAPP